MRKAVKACYTHEVTLTDTQEAEKALWDADGETHAESRSLSSPEDPGVSGKLD